MKKILGAFAVLAVAGACGLVVVAFKGDAKETVEFNNKTNGGCEEGAVVKWKYTLADLLKGNDVPNGCIDELNVLTLNGFLVATPSAASPDTCSGKPPAGTFSLTNVTVIAGDQTYVVPCASGSSVIAENHLQEDVQTCINLMNNDAKAREFVRTTLNSKAAAVDIQINATCTADSCFHIAYEGRIHVEGKVRGGGCK